MTKEYAIIVTSGEARSGVKSNPIVTYEGDKFWVTKEPEGWVSATSQMYSEVVPYGRCGVKTFPTYDAAFEFAARWRGHPWWCDPKSFVIVELEPKYKQVPDGYSVVTVTEKERL